MSTKIHTRFHLLLVVACLFSTLPGCSDKPVESVSSHTVSDDRNKNTSQNTKGTRDNSSHVLEPSADGTEIYACEVSSIDASHSSEGYIMVNYTGSNPKVKLQITGPNGITYTYNLHGPYEVFPLTSESGAYDIKVFENISGTSYSTAFAQTINASITNEFGPYLYPSQYVNFSPTTRLVKKGEDLAYSANNELEVVENVYNYVIKHISYDYDKAATVESGYLPDVDETNDTGKGICFDYAAVMATLLRTQGIPTQLQIGYMGDEYHAWISTYIEGTGWINGIIEFTGGKWKMLDPTFASTSSSPKNFLTDDAKYLLKYVY